MNICAVIYIVIGLALGCYECIQQRCEGSILNADFVFVMMFSNVTVWPLFVVTKCLINLLNFGLKLKPSVSIAILVATAVLMDAGYYFFFVDKVGGILALVVGFAIGVLSYASLWAIKFDLTP